MDGQSHWDSVYRRKAPNQVSWFRPRLETSLELIEQTGAGPSASIIDVGAGESTLVDDLLARGYSNLTALDISQAAIEATRKRMGNRAEQIRWLVADITQMELADSAYDVWHDRAVFHFLTAAADRREYVGRLLRSLTRGGHVILSTFGPEGPVRCSGLEVLRYDAESLNRELGPHFHLISSALEIHETPFGTTQQFLYCHFNLEDARY